MVLTNVLQSLSSLDDEEWRRIYAIPQHVQLLATVRLAGYGRIS